MLEAQPTETDVESCIQNNQLLLASGNKLPLLSNICTRPPFGERSGDDLVITLRDIGCSGVVPMVMVHVNTPYLRRKIKHNVFQKLSMTLYQRTTLSGPDLTES